MNLFQKLKFWLNNARYVSLPQSMLPAFLAISFAALSPGFSWLLAILSILGVVSGHIGLNLFDDYFDYREMKTNYRDTMVHEGMRARIGKCTYITSGEATMKDLLIACCVFSGVSLLFGLVILLISQNMQIVYFAVLTAILGISYSGAPLKLSYRGFGDILIGVMFGPMVMLGVYTSSCGTIDTQVVLMSIPVGLLVMNVVYTHSIMDFLPDKKIGKRTLAVLLNNSEIHTQPHSI